MFGSKVSWELSDSLLLFGTLLLTATFLGLSPLPHMSLAVSFVILAAYYLGKDIRKQHTEYQSLIDFEKTDNAFAKAFNLILSGLLLFGIFNVLAPYYSSQVGAYLMTSAEFLSVWVKTGIIYHLKFFFDIVFLIVFAKEFLVLLFKDVISFKSLAKSEPSAPKHKAQHEKHVREATFVPEEPKSGMRVKRVKVVYDEE